MEDRIYGHPICLRIAAPPSEKAGDQESGQVAASFGTAASTPVAGKEEINRKALCRLLSGSNPAGGETLGLPASLIPVVEKVEKTFFSWTCARQLNQQILVEIEPDRRGTTAPQRIQCRSVAGKSIIG